MNDFSTYRRAGPFLRDYLATAAQPAVPLKRGIATLRSDSGLCFGVASGHPEVTAQFLTDRLTAAGLTEPHITTLHAGLSAIWRSNVDTQ